ncbi:MAG: mannose-1-phosphate guanylyltransferase [Planctomycetota bacterium]
MLHAVIMAGGAGTRFWPASRKATPKQLLPLVGDQTMIRQTYLRLAGLTPAERTLIVTNKALVPAVAEELPELPAASVVGEPCKRDTAPCIGLAALLVSRDDPDATMAVMPSDHVIRDDARFRDGLKQAALLVEADPTRIVTFGIRPTYAARSFGYIQRGTGLDTAGDEAPAYQVKQFREKPDAATATEYLASGDFYWNSGIFVWKAQTILDALAERQPQMLEHLKKIGEAWGADQQQAVFDAEFAAIDGTSIDYAVMEHAQNVAVIEAHFDWDDLGSWQALPRQLGSDHHDNTVVGKHLSENTTGSIVRTSGDHLVVTLGLKDCLIVHTDNATLVANKHDEEAVRNIVKQLQERGWTDYL